MSTANQIDLNALLPYLISGGGGALAGALATGRRKAQSGEGRLGYLGRILKNSLLVGGVAGGSHYLLNKGVENLTSSGESATYDLQKKLGLEPEESATKSWTKELLEGKSGVGVGAAGYLATNLLPQRFIGRGSTNRNAALKGISDKFDVSLDDLLDKSVNQLEKRRTTYDATPNKSSISARQWSRAGLGTPRVTATQNALLKYLPWLAARKGQISGISRGPIVSNVLGLGSTRPQQAVRGLLALTAMAAPSLTAKNME